MKSAVNAINKVLGLILDMENLEKMIHNGELPKCVLKRKTPDFWFIYFELLEYCGLRVEKELDRNLNNAEILFMADKIENFLKVSLVS